VRDLLQLDGIPPVPATTSGLRPQADTSRVRDTNPLVSILFFPRATIRHIVSTNVDLYVPVLLVLTAFFNTLGQVSGRNVGDRVSIWIIVLGAMALAPLAIPFTTIGAWFGEWAGGKFGGVATRDEVRAAYAWAGVPAVAHSFLFWPAQAALFGGEIFRSTSPLMDESHPMVLIVIAVSAVFAYFWTVVVGIQVFAEVHQFSAWRSIGTGLLMMFVVLVPIVALLVVGIALTPR